MVAIVLATGQNDSWHGLDEHLPIPLIHLADRPFLQHVIEALVRHGVRRFEFVLSHLPERIEERFGDGSRWGCSFHYHLTPSANEALRVARGIASGWEDETILASGTSLPTFDISAVAPDMLLAYEGTWTGWARLAPGARMLLSLDLARVAASLPEGIAVYPVTSCISIDTGDEFLRAQSDALSGACPGLMIAGREAEPHVWISRNVELHPTVTILPPVYIGENCRIGKGASIGPSAVIGANCIVESQSVVVNSMVAPGTYVGEALELNSAVVLRNRLVNFRIGTSFLVSETFLLGSLTGQRRGRTLQRVRDRVIALILVAALWPILLGTYLFGLFGRRSRFVSVETVDIPVEDGSSGWRTTSILQWETAPGRAGGDFLGTFLPGLLSVIMGRIFLVGVQPRSKQQIQSLPSDWRALYLNSKAGLITEARVMFGPDATEDEIYTAESFYSATESGLHDLRLAFLWLRGMFSHSDQAATSTPADDRNV